MFYGGPSSNYFDISQKNRAFVFVGRRGLCRDNGVFQIHNVNYRSIWEEINLIDDNRFSYKSNIEINKKIKIF